MTLAAPARAYSLPVHHRVRALLSVVFRGREWSADRIGAAIGISGQRVRLWLADCDADDTPPHAPAWILADPALPHAVRRAAADALVDLGDKLAGHVSIDRAEDRCAHVAGAWGDMATAMMMALRDGHISSAEREQLGKLARAAREELDRFERAMMAGGEP